MTAASNIRACHHAHKPELENVDALTANVFHALGRVMHLNRLVMMKTVAQRGVHPQEGFALTFLCSNNGISQRELAQGLHLSRPRVSTIMRSLEEQGLIVRRPDEVDRRLTRIFTTPQGLRREEEQRAVLGDYVERTIGALDEADRRELDRILGRLAERIACVLQTEEAPGAHAEDGSGR